MATTYTSTLNIRFWRSHTCAACGGQFAYLMQRKIVGSGLSPEKASKKGQAKAEKAFAKEVDVLPCPSCGLYQPDMIAKRRTNRHTWIFVLAAVAFLGLLILKLTDTLRDDRVLTVAMATVALAGIAGFFADLRNFNRDLESNRLLADRQIAAGTMRHLTSGTPLLPEQVPVEPKFGRMIALILAAGGLLAAAGQIPSASSLRPSLRRRRRRPATKVAWR